MTKKKHAYQEIVAGELTPGPIKIVAPACRDLVLREWAPGHLSQDDRCEDHCADAMLYAVPSIRGRRSASPHKESGPMEREQMIAAIADYAERHVMNAKGLRVFVGDVTSSYMAPDATDMLAPVAVRSRARPRRRRRLAQLVERAEGVMSTRRVYIATTHG